MSALDIVTVVMLIGGILMWVSGRAIDKQTRVLHERNQRERERMEKTYHLDDDHVHG